MAKESVKVTIMGNELQVSCPDDKRVDLLKAASFLDDKMQDIRKNGRVIETERCAIIAALNIAYELLELQGAQEAESHAHNRIHDIESKIESALSTFKITG